MHDERSHPTQTPDLPRRRFTKGGLAAPVVLATLASKPVLGASYHCTVSGKISGNTSAPHGDGSCTINNVKSAAAWIATPIGQWPADAKNNAGTSPRLFKNSPKSTTPKFLDKYKKPDASAATLLDVLNGNLIGGAPNPALGKEAVTALLNALALGAPGNFPISASEVVRLFNGVIDGGTVEAAPTTYPGKKWGSAQVLSYFTCINGGFCPVTIPPV
jgi:hypothetical protein